MILLFAQTVTVLMLALWLSVGLHDNLRHPNVNGEIVRDVLRMRRLREEYPDIYAQHENRAVTATAVQTMLYRLIVLAEGTVALLLWLSVAALGLAVVGAFDTESARQFALLGPLGFCVLWSSFLVAGNYWCYWMCHEGAQNTHFQMTLWGLGVLILLAI